MNSIQMPDVETMVNRMKTVSDVGGDIDRFQCLFAQKIGGTPKVSRGVNLAFEMVAYELVHTPMATPFLYGMLSMDYDDYMLAIFTENPDFANECIEIRQQVIADMKAAKESQS